MASNVFGNPVTNETLEDMPEYKGKTITRQNRAHVALNMKNDGGKNKYVLQYVKDLKDAWGLGVATLCLIYNAIGDTITFVCEHSWHGHIMPRTDYPIEIANGQWGGFVHVQTLGTFTGSSAAVVYRGLNNDDMHCNWMAAWYTPPISNNTAYTEIREEGHYDMHDHWDHISNLLHGSNLISSDKWNKCLSNVTTESSTNAIFEGIFTLTDT